jgi:transcriptional regulator with XRE-family HTH domain
MVKSGKSNFIAEWRMFRGFKTQLELARAAGMTRPTVSRLETGAISYSHHQLEKLARVLGCSKGDLISTDPNLMGSVFQIYERIPEKDRQHALDVLQTFAVRRSRKPRRPRK